MASTSSGSPSKRRQGATVLRLDRVIEQIAARDASGKSVVALTWGNELERMTRIELALSAWEAARFRPLRALTWRR
jgi:hypothetical protein